MSWAKYKGEDGKYDKKEWYKQIRQVKALEIWLARVDLKKIGIESRFPRIVEIVMGLTRSQAEKYATTVYGDGAWVDNNPDATEVCTWFEGVPITFFRGKYDDIPELHPIHQFLKDHQDVKLTKKDTPEWIGKSPKNGYGRKYGARPHRYE